MIRTPEVLHDCCYVPRDTRVERRQCSAILLIEVFLCNRCPKVSFGWMRNSNQIAVGGGVRTDPEEARYASPEVRILDRQLASTLSPGTTEFGPLLPVP